MMQQVLSFSFIQYTNLLVFYRAELEKDSKPLKMFIHAA